jgi:hypothetical protein
MDLHCFNVSYLVYEIRTSSEKQVVELGANNKNIHVCAKKPSWGQKSWQ